MAARKARPAIGRRLLATCIHHTECARPAKATLLISREGVTSISRKTCVLLRITTQGYAKFALRQPPLSMALVSTKSLIAPNYRKRHYSVNNAQVWPGWFQGHVLKSQNLSLITRSRRVSLGRPENVCSVKWGRPSITLGSASNSDL